ncbi:hypothetical protein ABVT39_014373 [Epinephelus coioides]
MLFYVVSYESQGETLITLTLVPVEPDTQPAGSSQPASSQSVSPQNPLPVTPVSTGRATKPDLSEFQKSNLDNLSKPQDYDELYFMSLVGTFKRLSQQKKAQGKYFVSHKYMWYKPQMFSARERCVIW